MSLKKTAYCLVFLLIVLISGFLQFKDTLFCRHNVTLLCGIGSSKRASPKKDKEVNVAEILRGPSLGTLGSETGKHLKNGSHANDSYGGGSTKEKPLTEGLLPCYKQIYTWLNEKDWFHRNLIFKRTGEFHCQGLPCGVRIMHGENVTQLAESDVVFLFYKSSWNWNELMKHRSSKQKWVFWTSESPKHTHRRVIPPSEFRNTTYDYVMTYRTGATNEYAVIPGGEYGRYHNGTPTVLSTDARNWAEKKTKMVAWVATNCYATTLSWKRTEFVRAFSKHVGVDTYGPCGKQPCKKLETCGLQEHKFYLALENSQCRDYITEKFWYNSLALGLVPIVYGAPKEDYLRVAPPNSFIFVKDFPSLSALAAYLHKVDKNDTLYNQYFEWRKMGSISFVFQFANFEPERLCESVVRRLLDDEAKKSKTSQPVVSDWEEWWQNSCQPEGDFPIVMD